MVDFVVDCCFRAAADADGDGEGLDGGEEGGGEVLDSGQWNDAAPGESGTHV